MLISSSPRLFAGDLDVKLRPGTIVTFMESGHMKIHWRDPSPGEGEPGWRAIAFTSTEVRLETVKVRQTADGQILGVVGMRRRDDGRLEPLEPTEVEEPEDDDNIEVIEVSGQVIRCHDHDRLLCPFTARHTVMHLIAALNRLSFRPLVEDSHQPYERFELYQTPRVS